eukprot:1278591-Amphidinium_carterae.1
MTPSMHVGVRAVVVRFRAPGQFGLPSRCLVAQCSGHHAPSHASASCPFLATPGTPQNPPNPK